MCFAAFGLLPEQGNAASVTDRDFFAVDYTLFLNLFFILLTITFLVIRWHDRGAPGQHDAGVGERILFWLAIAAFAWLALGLCVAFLA